MFQRLALLGAAAILALAASGGIALADNLNWSPDKKNDVFSARGWDADQIQHVGVARCSDAGAGNYGEYPEYPDVLTVVCQVDDNNGEQDLADPGASGDHNQAPVFPPGKAP